MSDRVHSILAAPDSALNSNQVNELVAEACPVSDYLGKRLLLIIPDATRTAPVGLFFEALHRQLSHVAKAIDVMVALGTHPPMSEAAICERLEISLEKRREQYSRVQLLNHEWDNPAALQSIGVIGSDEISSLTGGL